MIKINDSFAEGELDVNSVVRNFRTTAQDGKNYNTKYDCICYAAICKERL